MKVTEDKLTAYREQLQLGKNILLGKADFKKLSEIFRAKGWSISLADGEWDIPNEDQLRFTAEDVITYAINNYAPKKADDDGSFKSVKNQFLFKVRYMAKEKSMQLKFNYWDKEVDSTLNVSFEFVV
jgi:hypothetical protein